MKSVSRIILAFLVGLGVGYGIWHGDDHREVFETAVVLRVIDGDTIELADGRRIRYIGVDAPEVAGSPKGEQSWGKEAKERNREMVEGKVVELQSGYRDKDDYGRYLRYVYVDTTFVNAELIAEGLARVYLHEPRDRYRQVFVRLEQYAKMRKVGIWSESEG